MKHTRNLAIFVMAALASLAAFATGTLDPLLQLVGLQPEGVLPLLMLANAPLGAELKTLVEGIQAGFAEFKKTNDTRLSQSDSDFQAKMAKIQTDITGLLDLKVAV